MEIINKFILKAREENRKSHLDRPDNYFSASSAGSCLRKIYFGKRIKKEYPLETLKVFKVGDLFHEFFQFAIKGENEKKVNFKHVNKGIEVSGRIDKITPEGEILEFKTTSNVRFSKERPDPNHVKQINIYLGIERKQEGRIIYIDKRNMEMVEHIVKYDEELFMQTMEEFSKVHVCLSKGKQPPRMKDANQNKYPCSYCLYKEECWNGN